MKAFKIKNMTDGYTISLDPDYSHLLRDHCLYVDEIGENEGRDEFFVDYSTMSGLVEWLNKEAALMGEDFYEELAWELDDLRDFPQPDMAEAFWEDYENFEEPEEEGCLY